jgi:ABC-type polysaccharide/polyol phosphate export permease
MSAAEETSSGPPLRQVQYTIGIVASLREVAGRWDLVRALVRRDLAVRYRKSALGVLWSLLTPLIQMVILTFVMKYAGGMTEPNLSVKILAGLVAWAYFQNSLQDCTDCILINRDLVKKIYFPRPALPLATVLGNTVHFGLLLLVLLLWLLLGVPDYRPTVQALWILPLAVIQGLMLAGLGMLLAATHTFFHDVKFMLMQLLGVLYFLSPVFYPASVMLPRLAKVGSWASVAYMYNPMATIIESYRRILFQHARPELTFLLPVAAFAVVIFLVGYRVFLRASWQFPEAI